MNQDDDDYDTSMINVNKYIKYLNIIINSKNSKNIIKNMMINKIIIKI